MSYEECIKACLDCAMDCENCLQKMMGVESHNDCPSCCRECLEICLLCAQAMTRSSKYVKEYCRLCAEICDWCSEQCDEHKYDHCKRCAESCRRCAEECRKVAAWNHTWVFMIKFVFSCDLVRKLRPCVIGIRQIHNGLPKPWLVIKRLPHSAASIFFDWHTRIKHKN